MAFQVSPGINVSEIDLTTVVPNVATSIGAIAGGFNWGPVLERVSITNENDLVKVFGKPDDITSSYFHTAANYLSYSNNLIVVRNVKAGALNAVVGPVPGTAAGTSYATFNADDYDNDEPNYTDQLFVAKYPGILGNSLKAIAIDKHGWDQAVNLSAGSRSTDQAKFIANFDARGPGTSNSMANANGWDGVEANRPTLNDEMHVLVIDEDGAWTGQPGYVLEKFAFISKASNAKRIDGSSNYIGTVLRNESAYIWLGAKITITTDSTDAGGGAPDRDAGGVMSGGAFKRINGVGKEIIGGSLGSDSGSLGVDDNALTDAELKAGYNLYSNPEVVDVSLIMAGPADASANATGQHIIDTIASVRKDCVVCVSPSRASVVATTGQKDKVLLNATALGSSSYAIMDSAWKYQYDRYNDVFRYVPMNGDVAGLCARTDFTNDAWWSPAGLTRGTVKNIIRLSWEPSKAERDELYQAGVNPIITQTGSGVVLWGDKTMQTVPSAFDRINVRRLFIVLEKAISIAAKAMLFEFNDEFTRSQFINLVEPFLREIQGRRGITDFKVVCDSSNNTGQIIDTNNFVGDIYVKPSRSINYIQLNFIAARSDVSFSEIGG
jgi:phage tail sheath protein FI